MMRLNGIPLGQARGPVLLVLVLAAVGWSQNVELVAVVSKSLSRTVDLPGEFQPFLMVSLHAKVPGYVERVLVDRGSVVKQGQPLVGTGADAVLLVIQQVSHLRLSVAVPEQDIGGIVA